jgi:hypothetical protein
LTPPPTAEPASPARSFLSVPARACDGAASVRRGGIGHTAASRVRAAGAAKAVGVEETAVDRGRPEG